MSTSSNNSNSSETSVELSTPIVRMVPFGIFIALIVPSILCYLFIFIQCICKGIIHKHIRSHAILAGLMCGFLQVTSELPIILLYLHNNIVPIQLDGFCKFWACQDYSFNVMILMLMGYTAIERYLLIFQRVFLHRHLIIFHYIPIILCIVYPIILYIYLIVFYPCVNQFDFTMITCGGPCYFYEPTISTFDQFFNLVLPVAVSTLASLALLMRILRQKQHMQQQNMWRKNRRLVIQLLYIVVLHNVVWLPMVIISSIMLFSTTPEPILVDLSINILPNGIYVVILLCPFVSLMSLPEIWPRVIPRIFPLTRTHNSIRHTAHLPMIHTIAPSRTIFTKQEHIH